MSPADCQGIAQKQTNEDAKARKAAVQLAMDAEARLKAASILKRKAAGGVTPDKSGSSGSDSG